MIDPVKIDEIRLNADIVEEMWIKHLETCEICIIWYESAKFETYGLKCVEGYINREKSVLFTIILDKLEHFVK